MTRATSVLHFGILLACLVQLSFGAAGRPRPNLVVILADDMGFSDAGCFGGEIATPNLDRLAGEGIRMTQFQNGGMCVVSRASLLTGQWWPRALRGFSKAPLLSERLREAGYRTGLIGKWHLDGHPMDRGFDHFFGFLGGFSDHFAGSKDYRLGRAPYRDFEGDYYSSDQFTERAIRFVRDGPADPSRKPFFLLLSYQAPHNPLQAPREDILKYRGKYLRGWQAVREARFERQKELGLFPADAELPAYPQNLPDWGCLTPAQRDLEDLRMAVFAAMIERMDRGIGRLLGALKQAGLDDNTLVLFLSDNGTDSFSVVDAAMLKRGRLPGDRGSNWQPGTGWAYASVTPWRLYKISQHGGGVTTGGIAWGPKFTRKPGRIESRPLHFIDVMPSFLELAGIKSAAGDLPGESFVPMLRGVAGQREGALYFQYMDHRAIRSTPWTLAEADGAGWELFHSGRDPLETRDAAGAHPEIVRGLEADWLRWWKRESGKPGYQPKSTRGSPHYRPQGDRGSGVRYNPSAMPAKLADRIPLPEGIFGR